MKKVNPFTGLVILLGVVGLLLLLMKVDSNAIVLLLFFLIYGSVLLVQLFQKKVWNHMWGYLLLLLAAAIVLQTLISLWTHEFYWQGIVIPSAMYALIYRKVYPKETF